MSDAQDPLKLLDTKVKLFDALTKLWAHADIYLWHRARIIVAIQAGVLAGSYAIEHHLVAAMLLTLGAFVSYVLHMAVKRDEQTRNSYLVFLDPLAKEIFAEPLYSTLPTEFRMIPPVGPGAPYRAGALIDTTFSGLIIGNLILAGFFIGRASHLL